MSEWREAIILAVSLSLLTAAVGVIFNIVDLTMIFANNINESIAKTITTSNFDDYDEKIVDRNTARNIARRYYFNNIVCYNGDVNHPFTGNDDIKDKISARGDYKIEVIMNENNVKCLSIRKC